jgi:hypothetical protein
MAVKVMVDDQQKQSSTVQHGHGDKFEVHDGHLMVGGGGEWIAVYVPGKWIRAEVTSSS